MNERSLKNQLSVFGRFHFPPSPQTTVQLTQVFQSYELMPNMVNVSTPGTNRVEPRLSLQRSSDGLYIVFADDRIDIGQSNLKDGLPFPKFLTLAQNLLGCLSHLALKYTRVAIVRELLLDEISEAKIANICKELLPRASPNPLEWTARWVDRVHGKLDQFNVACDVRKMQAYISSMNDTQISFDGMRLLFDVSTSQENVDPRYSNINIDPIIQELNSFIDQRRVEVGL